MARFKKFKANQPESRRTAVKMEVLQNGQLTSGTAHPHRRDRGDEPGMRAVIDFLDAFRDEVDGMLERAPQNPHLNMTAFLVSEHLHGRPVTASSLVAAAGVPYATARRRMEELFAWGMIEQRPRTRSGKSFTLHPSSELLQKWAQFSDRVQRLALQHLGTPSSDPLKGEEYYFGGSYIPGRAIGPPEVLPRPLELPGGLRILVHGDPTFMVMENLKRQFEQIIGTNISQRAFSIDRLREEALRNSERKASRYDIIAVDLPWIGEFVEKKVLLPLDKVMDLDRLDAADFHTAGWQAAHWGAHPYGVPSQTTPELLFYRTDLFAEAGLEAPATTDAVLKAAEHFHQPARGRYGVAWNAARGTALGHQFLMTCADFGQPILNLDRIAGGYQGNAAGRDDMVPTIDTPLALDAADYLRALLSYSPPDILSMSWYERVRPYAAGKIAMAYGYTLLAPYFERDETSPAHGNTGYLPHPAGPQGMPVAPVGGYVMGMPANLPAERRAAAAEALIAFTSPQAQKLYVLNGSRTAPRYSVGSDPEVRRISPIFEAVDAMSWRDELQFWPRPPVPEICAIFQICGEEMHDMLRGISTPRDALRKAQARAEEALREHEPRGRTSWTPTA